MSYVAESVAKDPALLCWNVKIQFEVLRVRCRQFLAELKAKLAKPAVGLTQSFHFQQDALHSIFRQSRLDGRNHRGQRELLQAIGIAGDVAVAAFVPAGHARAGALDQVHVAH